MTSKQNMTLRLGVFLFTAMLHLLPRCAIGQSLTGEIGADLFLSQGEIKEYYGTTGGIRLGLWLKPFDGFPLYLGPRFGAGLLKTTKEGEIGSSTFTGLRAVSVSDVSFALRLAPKFEGLAIFIEGMLGELNLTSHTGVKLKVDAFGNRAGTERFYPDDFETTVFCRGVGAGFVVDKFVFEAMYLTGKEAEIITEGYFDRNDFVTEMKKPTFLVFQVAYWFGFE